ncbi:MAG: trypsin-like peptidase domain-containing protein, partial [Oscillospiraceae bacterium]
MSDDRVERPDDEKEDVSQPEEPTQETPHNPFGARPNQGGCEHSSAPYGQYGAYNPYQQSNAGAGNRRGEEYRWNFEDYEAAGHGKPPKRNRGLLVFGVLLAVVMVVGIVGLSAVGVYSLLTRDDDAPPANSAAASLPSGSSAPTVTLPGLTIKDRPSDATNSASQDGTLSTIEIARRVRPSVVGVITYGSYNSFQPSGEGSGIVMNADGYILTNAHVVEGAIGINVKLDNGDSYAAELIGSDAKSDLAVIRIQADELAAAEFGNSDELEAGERVVAIGNPGGTILAGSVTQGIVSGLNRALSDGGGYSSRYIQV